MKYEYTNADKYILTRLDNQMTCTMPAYSVTECLQYDTIAIT